MDLFNAVRENDSKRIQALLHQGQNPNFIDEETGKSSLHMAVVMDNLSTAQLMVHRGACVKAADLRGNQPIHAAISNTNLQIADFLLENGADINAENEKKISPLFLAIASDCPEVVDFVLKRGGRTNATNMDGKTPIMIAAVNGNFAIVERLMEEFVLLSIKDVNNKDVLHFAAIGGKPQIFKLILETMKAQDIIIHDYSETLLAAAQRGYAKIVYMLLENTNCDINFTNGMRQSPLHVAVQGKYKQTVKALLKHEATVDRRDHGILGSNTPLIYAGKKNMSGILKLLLDAGAELERTNIEEKTALFYSSENGHLQSVSVILHYYQERTLERFTVAGDEIWHYQSPLQVIMQSPLEAAVVGGHSKIVDALLKGGMIRKLKSALLYSAKRGSAKIFKCLVKYISSTTPRLATQSHYPSLANWQKALVLAITNGHQNIVRFFVRKGFSHWLGYDFVRQPILQSKTALHLAAGGGFLDIIRLLLRNGADVDARDEFENSPLMYAVEMNKVPVVAYLLTQQVKALQLKERIDVNLKNSMAMHLAAMNGNHLMISKLVIAGCDINVPCNWPVTAGHPSSIQQQNLNGFYPVILTVINRNFQATVTLLNASCSLNCNSMVNMTYQTPLTCTIKFDDPQMFQCLHLSGALSHDAVRRQSRSILMTDNAVSSENRDWVKTALNSPIRLLEICRQVIRSRLGGLKEEQVTQVGLPAALQRYVIMKDYLESKNVGLEVGRNNKV